MASLGRFTARLIRQVKDHGETALLAALLGPKALAGLGSLLAELGATGALLVPMPSSRRSWRKRGFNLARDLALWLAKNSSVPCVVSRALEFTYEPEDQRGLDTRHRSQNIAGTMSLDRSRFDAEFALLGAHCSTPAIIVCDDVITTGASIGEAIRAIRGHSQGLRPLGFLALAETLLKSVPRARSRV
jgi:predicted amidophosphoribosyltransferase